jgi:hypothetical protein
MDTLYFAYLDEFGHIGPYLSRTDAHHKTSPVFGLGGLVLPYDEVREFATWFYKLKCDLLALEIQQSATPAYQWEKKGSALFTSRNILQYPELRRAVYRILNRIARSGGTILYVGVEKRRERARHDSKKLYATVLREAIKRLDQFCAGKRSKFFLILDEQREVGFRADIVAEASRQMFGENPRTGLIEPPIQAESHLYQTLQCADWLCGLVGRVVNYQVAPQEFPDLTWTETYFSVRLKQAGPTSGIRKQK